MEQLLAHSYSKCLFVESREHPVVCVDPVMNTRAARERQCQLLFERFDSPAVFLASSAVLNAFSTGRTTALVLDVGSNLTTCVPVFEGFKLQKGVHLCASSSQLFFISFNKKTINFHAVKSCTWFFAPICLQAPVARVLPEICWTLCWKMFWYKAPPLLNLLPLLRRLRCRLFSRPSLCSRKPTTTSYTDSQSPGCSFRARVSLTIAT